MRPTDTARFAAALTLAFGVTLGAAWLWGSALVEALLPVARWLLTVVDDRFEIHSLALGHNWQDTVVRLRVNLVKPVVLGGHITFADPRGWLEVTTTTGAMLQPMVIATGLAAAWPGALTLRLARAASAAFIALLFLMLDLPLTLHAYVWDMFRDAQDPQGSSPLLMWHEFLLAGGRLGMGVVFALLPVWIETRLARQA